MNDQTENKYLFSSTSNGANNVHIASCHLEVGAGIRYPDVTCRPSTGMSRVFRDVFKCSHYNDDYVDGSILNRSNFSTSFDLEPHEVDLRDSTTKLTFHYELTGAPGNADYSIFVCFARIKDRDREDEWQAPPPLTRSNS